MLIAERFGGDPFTDSNTKPCMMKSKSETKESKKLNCANFLKAVKSKIKNRKGEITSTKNAKRYSLYSAYERKLV